MPDQPVVKRYQAESKNNFQRWLDDNKQDLKIRGSIAALIAVAGGLIFGLIQLIF